MDAIFTIPYGEFAAADKLIKSVTKYRKVSAFVPASRQEKGIDLVLYSDVGAKNEFMTVQVKQSRTYYENKVITVGGKKVPVTGYLWFNRFDVPDNADWFLLVGTRVVHPKTWNKASVTDVSWDPIILAFNNAEMKTFMANVKQRKNPTKDDKMFGFHYDDNGRVYQVRGCAVNCDVTDYLLENRITEILKSFK